MGIEYTDTGFILGLAHRISTGQKIYFDFDYVRPPLTPLIWSIPMRFDIEAKEVLVRSLVLVQKIAISWCSYLILQKNGVENKICIWASIITLAFSIHHIPLMPWHTTDGLFFAYISATFYTLNSPATAMAFAIMAALTKQSYYPFPLTVLALSIIQFPNRRLTVLLTSLFFGVILFRNPYLSEFYKIAKDSTPLKDVMSFAINPHLKIGSSSLVYILCALAILLTLRKGAVPALIGLAILYPQADLIYSLANDIVSSSKLNFPLIREGVTHITMTLSVIHILLFLRRVGTKGIKNKQIHIAAILLSAAWMSTISWGYANYLFAYGLLLSANLVLLQKSIHLRPQSLTALSCITIATFLIIRLVAPYRMNGPLLEKYEMVQSGHYKFIWASKTDIEKLESIKNLSKQSGCKETYPAAPQAALVGGYTPYMRADWKMDVEYPSHKDALQDLAKNNCKLFVERDRRIIGWVGKFKSSAIDLNSLKYCSDSFDNHFYLIDFSLCKIDLKIQNWPNSNKGKNH
jgi:hypothetical protein